MPTLELVDKNGYLDTIVEYIYKYQKNGSFDHIAVIGSVKVGKRGNLGI
jgi:hypothetical protein